MESNYKIGDIIVIGGAVHRVLKVFEHVNAMQLENMTSKATIIHTTRSAGISKMEQLNEEESKLYKVLYQ